jgi:hypothetical protein
MVMISGIGKQVPEVLFHAMAHRVAHQLPQQFRQVKARFGNYDYGMADYSMMDGLYFGKKMKSSSPTVNALVATLTNRKPNLDLIA